MKSKDRLNVIIPLYNPHPGWENYFVSCLSELTEELKETAFEIIVVNDGSTTSVSCINDISNRFKNLRYFSYPVNRGKGFAIRYGVNISHADFYIYTDVDFPFGWRIISQTYQKLASTGTDLVIGTRDHFYFRNLPLKRRLYSFILKELNYLLTEFRIKDTQAGLKGLNNKAKDVLLRTGTDTFLFELEFLKNCLKEGLKYELIDIRCRPGVKFTNFRFHILLKEVRSFIKIIFH